MNKETAIVLFMIGGVLAIILSIIIMIYGIELFDMNNRAISLIQKYWNPSSLSAVMWLLLIALASLIVGLLLLFMLCFIVLPQFFGGAAPAGGVMVLLLFPLFGIGGVIVTGIGFAGIFRSMYFIVYYLI